MSDPTVVANGAATDRASSAGTVLRTSPREDLAAIAFITWLFLGVFADFWAHKNLTPAESIITPWHGVLYSGFAVSAAWILHLIDRTDGHTWRTGTPDGYLGAVFGIALVLGSAVVDLTWHAVFGVEQGIDALLSPSHLLLFTGFTLIALGPVSSIARRETGRRRGLLTLLPAILGLTYAASLWMLVVRFLSLFQSGLAPVARQPTGVARMVVTTLLIATTVVYLIRRWDPPIGAVAIVTMGIVLAVAITDEIHTPRAVLAGLSTGLLLEVLARILHLRMGERWIRVAFAAVTSAAFAGAWLAIYAVRSQQGWHPASLFGSVTLCGLAGLGIAELMQPRPHEIA